MTMGIRERVQRSAEEVRQRGKRLAELNLELAKLEIRRAATKYGGAVGLFAATALFVVFGLGFLLATIVALIALALPVWAALLIVTALLLLSAAALVLAALRLLRGAKSPLPQQALAEAQATVGTAQHGVRRLLRRMPVAHQTAATTDEPLARRAAARAAATAMATDTRPMTTSAPTREEESHRENA